ncbi:hypothetical protein JCM3766R1_004323 [Sporobolomyces carnicolor]
MARFVDLAPEVIEHVFRCTQDSTSASANRSHLLRLELVSKQTYPIARRLLYRSLHIKSPSAGKKFLATLQRCRSDRLGDYVRFLKISDEAFMDRTIFSDLSQDDIVRQAHSLVSLESLVSSFAPTSDGRKPWAAYPVTLESIRLSPTYDQWLRQDYDDDDSDGSSTDGGSEWLSRANVLSTLNSLAVATSLTSITIKRTAMPTAKSSSPTPSALAQLRSIVLDETATPFQTFQWLAARAVSNRTLRSLKVWTCNEITPDNLYTFFSCCGDLLEELTYKPTRLQLPGATGNATAPKFPALRFLSFAWNLRRLSLGHRAADHTLYEILPRTLTHLTVALPDGHVNARLSEVATALRTRLRSLVKLELYSQKYFPNPLDISYPPTSIVTGRGVTTTSSSSLRELRLSHIKSTTVELQNFVESVGSNLYSLALHHVGSTFSPDLLGASPSLRRLDLGRCELYPPAAARDDSQNDDDADDAATESDIKRRQDEFYAFRIKSHKFLHTLRVHFDSKIRVADLVRELDVCRPNGHEGIAPVFGDSTAMNELFKEAKRCGTMVLVNGNTVETFGDLWSALLT